MASQSFFDVKRIGIAAAFCGAAIAAVVAFDVTAEPKSAFEQALELCTRELERPSTIETEATFVQSIEDSLFQSGWSLLDPYDEDDLTYFRNTFGIGSELLRVADKGARYGAQYNGASAAEYWQVIQQYMPPSAQLNLEPQDPNPRNRWYVGQDQSALLELDTSPASNCNLYIHADAFDAMLIKDIPDTEVPVLADHSYTYKYDPDADFDGGVSTALMIDGDAFETTLQTSIPNVWWIDIRRGY